MVADVWQQKSGHLPERIVAESGLRLQLDQVGRPLPQPADERVAELRLVGEFQWWRFRREMASARTTDEPTDVTKADA